MFEVAEGNTWKNSRFIPVSAIHHGPCNFVAKVYHGLVKSREALHEIKLNYGVGKLDTLYKEIGEHEPGTQAFASTKHSADFEGFSASPSNSAMAEVPMLK